MNGTVSKDRHLAEDLFEKHKNTMYHIAFSVLRNSWEAEDAVMDAMVRICKNIERFQGISEKETKLLILRYTENAARDRARKIKHVVFHEESNTDEHYDAIPEENNSAESEYFDDLARSCHDFGELNAAIKQLDEKYRDILCLRYGENWTNQEISDMLNISLSTVATRLSRAKAKLRTIIREKKS